MEPRAFTEKQIELVSTFADQSVIAIENVRLFNETKEALEQQTATAEILQVISKSTTNVQPVLETIAANARQLLAGSTCGVILIEEGEARMRAIATIPGSEDYSIAQKAYPMPLAEFARQRPNFVRVMETRKPTALKDAETELTGELLEFCRAAGIRSNVVVPMIRGEESIGLIIVNRHEPHVTTPEETRLLQSFASQAVIAIENVRLFNETKEALERQTATAEILKVISGSPTNEQPVFDAIVQSAARLFGRTARIRLLEGNGLRLRARSDGDAGDAVIAIDRESAGGRAFLERRPIQLADASASDSTAYARRQAARAVYRAIAVAPLVRENSVIGLLAVTSPRPGVLNEKQMALLTTFADQAVIAIENVRLFKELESRTEALSKSVNQLTALGEVGRAVSSTLDLDTVLKTIVSRAVQLTGLDAGVIYEYDEAEDRYKVRAWENLDDVAIAQLRATDIRHGEGAIGKSVATREPVQVPDTHSADYPARLRELLDAFGYRAILAVPLLQEGRIAGALMMIRKAPGVFVPEVVELLKTFGTQSAMAIQNARLYREIAEKGRQLETASQHKSQFLASMSHELRTPLNAILGFNEMLLGGIYGDVPGDMQEPLKDIQTSGKHLLRLINNVLDLAKIEAGRMELALGDYSVHDTVAGVQATLRPLAAEKGLDFVAKVPQDIPPAYGDAGRLTQCLMNLAGNSLKFTKQGKVEIAVAQENGKLRYCVSDTGMGIAPEKIGSLFTEFKQTDATIASEYGGTGLGLSITKKFIEMHGGRIWVESELGRGSSFIFEIPLRTSA